MKDINSNGLSRKIPEHIRREVRQRVGFGCVICGDAFYHYEHFDPEFHDATNHEAKGITLLCAKHHDAKTRHRLSIDCILAANDNPKALSEGFSRGALEFGRKDNIVQLGNVSFHSAESIVTINGHSIFKIEAPEEPNGPFLLTFIPTHNGPKIIKNEWFGNSKSWDITTVDNKIVVKDKKDHVLLSLENRLNDRIVVKQMDIQYDRIHISTKTIPKKKFGPSLEIQKHNAFRIVNSQKQEIARITDWQLENSEVNVTWKHAFNIEDDFLSPNIDKMEINGADFFYAIRPNAELTIVGNNISNTTLKIGGYSPEVEEFIKIVNEYNPKTWTRRKRADFRNKLKYLQHSGQYDQISLGDRQIIKLIE